MQLPEIHCNAVAHAMINVQLEHHTMHLTGVLQAAMLRCLLLTT
jgi:hypothetical protein